MDKQTNDYQTLQTMKNLLSLQSESRIKRAMATATTRTERIKNIAMMADKLSSPELEELERQLKLFLLMIETQRFDAVPSKSTLTMKEIVEEVKKVRHARKS